MTPIMHRRHSTQHMNVSLSSTLILTWTYSLSLMNAEEIKRVNECHNDIALGSDQNT